MRTVCLKERCICRPHACTHIPHTYTHSRHTHLYSSGATEKPRISLIFCNSLAQRSRSWTATRHSLSVRACNLSPTSNACAVGVYVKLCKFWGLCLSLCTFFSHITWPSLSKRHSESNISIYLIPIAWVLFSDFSLYLSLSVIFICQFMSETECDVQISVYVWVSECSSYFNLCLSFSVFFIFQFMSESEYVSVYISLVRAACACVYQPCISTCTTLSIHTHQYVPNPKAFSLCILQRKLPLSVSRICAIHGARVRHHSLRASISACLSANFSSFPSLCICHQSKCKKRSMYIYVCVLSGWLYVCKYQLAQLIQIFVFSSLLAF